MRKSKFGIGINALNRICAMLDSNSLLPGSSDLLAQANVPHFKKRLDDSWRDETPARQAENQEKFLRVVVAAMSVTQTEFSNNFLREVRSRK